MIPYRTRFTLVCILIVVLASTACGGGASPTPTRRPNIQNQSNPNQVASPTTVPSVPTDAPTPTGPPVPTDTPTPTAGPPGLAPNPLESVTAAPDGLAATDARGASLEVPPDALTDGIQGELAAYDAAGQLVQALSASYTVETPFYSVSAQGADDGIGRATLSLPAPDPQSRLLVVINEQWPVLLDVAPEAGVLRLRPRLGPGDTSGAELVGSLAPGGSIHYAVVTPKAAAQTGKRVPGTALGVSDRDCAPDVDPNLGVTFYCRKNPAGTVYVNYPPSIGLAQGEIDRVVDVIEAVMKGYADKNFVPAKLTRSSPVFVQISPGGGSPEYSYKTGVVTLPVDSAKSAAGGPGHDLYHELAHWIQDEEYVMAWARVRGAKTWWIETAAENMVMLLDPAYVDRNLTFYGNNSLDQARLVFQSAPYQWPGESYVQAQLVRLNMCDDPIPCPLSEASFVKAINAGTYPFEDASAQQKLSNSLDNYARYLLGVAPLGANPNLPLGGAVASGDGYGEFVNILRTDKSDFEIKRNGNKPQMKFEKNGATQALVIEAPLEKDGVYPLVVSSGIGGDRTGFPAALAVAPGAPFWYRVGDGEVQFHDGSKELVLAPIHAKLGLPMVRIVALGRKGGEVFKARVALVDLTGTWVFFPGKLVEDNVVCTTDGQPDAENEMALAAPSFIGLGSALGEYALDEAGVGLSWMLNAARLPPELEPGAIEYDGAALLRPEKIEVQARFQLSTTPSDARAAPSGPWALAMLGGTLPLAFVGYRVRRRRWIPLGLLALALALLVGCGLGLTLTGTDTATIRFNKLEWVGGKQTAVIATEGQPKTDPLWRLKNGRGTFELDFTTVAAITDPDGKTTESVSHCAGNVVFQVSGAIYKDVVLQFLQE